MDNLNLIMLSAMYENGGNTTHRLLDGHPELMVYPFESQVGTPGNGDYLSSTVPTRYRWPEFSTTGDLAADYESFWDEELKTLLRVPGRSKFKDCGLDVNEDDRRKAFSEFMADKPRTRGNLVSAYFYSMFKAWRNLNRSGKERFYVGYNPVQILDAGKILSDFPKGHILHVVRNPWSGYADTKKRPFPLSLERYVWTWNLSQLTALNWKERVPDRVHIVRFEDIVKDTKTAFADFLAGTGLEWNDSLLAPSFNGVPLTEVFPWGTIRTPTTEANIATANELNAEETQAIAVQSAVMGRQLGYADFLKAC